MTRFLGPSVEADACSSVALDLNGGIVPKSYLWCSSREDNRANGKYLTWLDFGYPNRGVGSTEAGGCNFKVCPHLKPPQTFFEARPPLGRTSPPQSWHPSADRVPRQVPAVDDAGETPRVGNALATAQDSIELHKKMYAPMTLLLLRR